MFKKLLPDLLSGIEFKTSIVAVSLLSTLLIYLGVIVTATVYSWVTNKDFHMVKTLVTSLQWVLGTFTAGVVGNSGFSVLQSKVNKNNDSQS